MTTTWRRAAGSRSGWPLPPTASHRSAAWTGTAYEQWVAGIDVDTGAQEGPGPRATRTRCGSSRSSSTGPKTWSLAAALHPRSPRRIDAAQDKAARGDHRLGRRSTRRPGSGRGAGRCRSPVERIEAAVIRHYTSRAGDPHRHLHLQVNARVWAAGAVARACTRSGSGTASRPSTGSGTPPSRPTPSSGRVLAAHGFTLDPETSEIRELAPYVGRVQCPGRADPPQQSTATRPSGGASIPARSPARDCGEAWDRRAWAQARPTRSPRVDGARARRAVERTSCATSATATRTEPPSQLAGTPAGLGRPGRRRRPGRLPCSARSGRRGTPPTSAARSRSCSPDAASSPTPRCGSSWPRTSPPAPSTAARRCSRRRRARARPRP